ncbi:MAG TPA: D-2-hydroxyacid dehydrogenase [Syntrophomonadaceae bacterium]|nr:D-2-hydroxyacid dehydrogenase [Syntrophomonadaceae bacterium]HPR93730.1 D-2-hydroxyacid dehydrogenase [Syntrophomonadaceae bacterium]
MPDICILDAKTLGPDIDLSPLQQLGKLHVYEVTAPHEVSKRIENCEIIISNKVILNETNLKQAPQIKLICLAATGTNNVDLDYAARQGIAVCNVAGYSTRSVVQHTFAMLFYLLQSSAYYDNYVKSGQYCRSDIFTHLNKSFWELSGKTWGIIGLGTIGRSVASLATAFGCQAVYYSTSGLNNTADYRQVTLTELLQESDIVSIHAPLNRNTQNLIGYEQLKLMQAHAILLNLGRGGIVNETGLAAALNENLLKGAGLDVLENEPLKEDSPLLHINEPEKLFITPHIAWASQEARRRLVEEIALNISGFLSGSPRNLVG